MMARKSDNVYHCPINNDGTYSYTEGGHEVKFKTGVHEQISPSMNANRQPKPTFLSGRVKDLEIVDKGEYDFEKLYGDQYKPNMGHEEPEPRETQPDGAEQLLCKKASNDSMSNLFGPVQNKTRFCPDHSDVQIARIADCVYQCPIDGAIYNWEAGFKKQNGTEVPGASVANMTPDLPGYYSSPHVI
jgi:hypothetical protein